MNGELDMGIKDWFKKPEPVAPKVKKPRQPRKPKLVDLPPTTPINPEKVLANELKEPWVSVVGIDLDVDNLGSGAFNLDWNDIFVARLVKAGYRGKDDVQIVDQWFNDVCRNVLAETYEQSIADPTNRKPTNF